VFIFRLFCQTILKHLPGRYGEIDGDNPKTKTVISCLSDFMNIENHTNVYKSEVF